MRGAAGGKARWVLVAGMLVGGCAEKPAVPPQESVADPIRAGLVIDLAVLSGPHAGRYHVETLQGSCSRRTFGRGSWRIRYAKEGATPSAMDLTIADAAAAEGGTGEVTWGVTFGTDARRGSGTATVRVEGVGAMVRVDGRTNDGIRFSATIRCNEVLRVAGMDGG